jgi:hypothetical protein
MPPPKADPMKLTSSMTHTALLARLAAAKPLPVLGPLVEFFVGAEGPDPYVRTAYENGVLQQQALFLHRKAGEVTAIVVGHFGLN